MIIDPNEIRIAGNRKISDWEKLKQELYNQINNNWIDAFDFFEKRINSRYIRPIEIIQCFLSNKGEGFAIVNLQCSLIETIESFYNGWIYKNDKDKQFHNGYYFRRIEGKPIPKLNNEKIFVNFFKEMEPFDGKIDGADFFLNVRCGLLHETQTKHGWRILGKHSDPETFFCQHDNDKIIYHNNFQKGIEKVINNYKMAIVDGEPYGTIAVPELRENFIAKFDHICNLSKPKP